MKKLSKLILILMIVCLLVTFVAACGDKGNQGDGGTDNGGVQHVDYASQLKLDMNSNTLKQVVTRKSHIDGDTVHFYVPSSVVANGVLKARFLAVNTPESTGQIEDYGHMASRFTKEALKNAAFILIESDNDQWNVDSTGERRLVWVWYKPTADSDYRNLNVELLQNGLAVASNTANNRYGETAMAALNQAKNEKLYVHSGKADPEIYAGEAIPMTLKELRTNIANYTNMKVSIEGIVAKNSNQTAYVEQYDEITEMYYGIAVYYGYSFQGARILKVGNAVRIVGTVQYYENGGTYQISDVKYNVMDPNNPNNVKLISENNEVAYTLVDANTFKNGKVNIETETEEAITTKEYDFAELMLSASISMENLKVKSVYTTDNGNDSDGAMTLTCEAEDGTKVDVRTIVITDENGDVVTEDAFEGKTINVLGIVDLFGGKYQVKVFRYADITFVE
ncbi:MAG: thermonuclease family protein [Clostridia bacterium]|nr:thermonuclease family protein [Clostridia bacterium]